MAIKLFFRCLLLELGLLLCAFFSNAQSVEREWEFPTSDECLDTINGNLNDIKRLSLKTYWYKAADLPLEKLKNLEYLSISHCRVDDVRLLLEKLSGLPKLAYLNLEGNRIDSICFLKGSFPSLRYLSVSNCYVHYLDSSISELRQLEYLNLGWASSRLVIGNTLHDLPKSMSSLTKLTSLIYTHSNLDCLPDVITELSSLRYLNLAANSLKMLPDKISNLSNLKILDISYNKFDTVPSVVEKMKNLKLIM